MSKTFLRMLIWLQISNLTCFTMKFHNYHCADKGTVEATCKGDSGGPLIVPKSSTDDTAVIISVNSFGPENCVGKRPEVFTYVTKYLDWIKPKMER